MTVTKSVNLEVPAWTANNIVGAGYIGIDNGVTSIFAGPTANTLSQGYQNGSNWHTYVPIPSDFTGTGQWQYAQIVTPGEYETPVGGTQKQSTETGLTGLDDVFPYGVLHDTGGSFVTDVDSPNFQVLDAYSAVTLGRRLRHLPDVQSRPLPLPPRRAAHSGCSGFVSPRVAGTPASAHQGRAADTGRTFPRLRPLG